MRWRELPQPRTTPQRLPHRPLRTQRRRREAPQTAPNRCTTADTPRPGANAEGAAARLAPHAPPHCLRSVTGRVTYE
jgi:hypothetical protein